MKCAMRVSLPTCFLFMSVAASLVLHLSGCGDSEKNSANAVSADAGSTSDAAQTATPDLSASSNCANLSVCVAHGPSDGARVPDDGAASETQTDGAAGNGVPSGSDAATVADGLPTVDAAVSAGDVRHTGTSAPDCSLDGGPTPLVRLSPKELKTILDSSENPYLVNVKGSTIPNIPGTDAVLASDAPGVEKLVGGDRCADIIVYCRTGVISQTVSAQLIADGYRHVRDLTGGVFAWRDAGYPTE